MTRPMGTGAEMLRKPGYILWEARLLRPAAKLKTSSYGTENATFDRSWKPERFRRSEMSRIRSSRRKQFTLWRLGAIRRRAHALAAAALLCSFMTGCADSVRPTTTPSGNPMQRVKVLTYNTLHGLEPSGLTVKASESKEARQARLNLQFQQLSLVQPDVVLLQEVNPLPAMAERFVKALKTSGFQYSEVHQVDACGVRVAGLAVVPDLNNGLAVLTKAPLKLRKIKGLKLSGGFGGCRDFIGLQTGELRYALIAEIENPNTGRRFLAISLHLHSGIERNAFFIQKINEAIEQGRIRREDFEGIVTAMEQDQERRLDEIRVLVKEIQKLQAQGPYFGVIIGGDFNFEPDDPEYRELERAGLRDTYMIAGPTSDVYSLDPQRNPIAGQAVREVPSGLREAMTRLPDSQQQRILEGYRKGISEARRVDFLFLMHSASESPTGCLRQELFGQPTAVSAEPGSDHYGVLAMYIADSSQC
jgi:endonuclease/exonuclease/phosphatase family metal-dependent hydrolase